MSENIKAPNLTTEGLHIPGTSLIKIDDKKYFIDDSNGRERFGSSPVGNDYWGLSDTKWIKCKDRMPPKEERVLIYDDRGYKFTEDIYIAFYENGKWIDDEYLQLGATHWMPLPLKPRETK